MHFEDKLKKCQLIYFIVIFISLILCFPHLHTEGMGLDNSFS